MSEPTVAILIPTYARVAWLEEALHSALSQEYSGDIVVVVGNDCPWQHLSCADPRVELMRWGAPFRTLGEKRNAMLAYARTVSDWIAFVDDDDVLLPWHVSSHFDRPAGVVRCGSHSVYLHGDDAKAQVGGPPVRLMLHRRVGAVFDANLDSGEDQALWRQVSTQARIIDNSRSPSYVYQWGNGTYHISGSGRPIDGESYRADALARRAAGKEPEGIIRLQPCWRRDYMRLTEATRRAI